MIINFYFRLFIIELQVSEPFESISVKIRITPTGSSTALKGNAYNSLQITIHSK